jgi:hypothetical protein
MKVPERFLKKGQSVLDICYKIKLQSKANLAQAYPLTGTINRQKHYCLYNFWCRSEGIWFSKLVKVAVRLLDEQELLAISNIHHLEQAEFGIKTAWEYNSKAESGYMSWCVNANQPSLVFTNNLLNNTPQIINYQMVDENQLVMTGDNYEETYFLDGENRRLRELRYNGKLLRRLWEDKFAA